MDDSTTVIGTVGLNGSGKDTLIEYLHEEHGVPVLSMGDIVRDMAAERGIRPTRSNLHDISQETFEAHGRDYFARQIVERIEAESWDTVGVTGIRSPADVETLRSHFGDDLTLIHVRVGDARTRFERVSDRDTARDPDRYQAFLRQDEEEREMFDIDEAVEMADLTVDNDGSLDAFYQEIEERVVGPILGDREQG